MWFLCAVLFLVVVGFWVHEVESGGVIAIGVCVIDLDVHFVVGLLEGFVIPSFIHFVILDDCPIMVVRQWTLTSSSALFYLLIMHSFNLVIIIFGVEFVAIFVIINENARLAFCVGVIDFFYDV